MFALPAQPRRLRQRFFHYRRGIDEHLDLTAASLDQPAPQPLEPLFHQIVVIAPLRIGADRRPIRRIQRRQRVALGRVNLCQHEDRPRLGPQRIGRDAPAHPLCHPAHLPVPPRSDIGRQPTGGLGYRIGPANPDLGKPLGHSPPDHTRFQIRLHRPASFRKAPRSAPDARQKSRSA
ncbi:hypothetical protein GALL_548300 [mine drainage metagenome]|uniref:Uncharacterized protein n=1 Tax=mine drainage metagenome TaxID=410659 RepID=A0A1J5NXX5_9ZZZZ